MVNSDQNMKEDGTKDRVLHGSKETISINHEYKVLNHNQGYNGWDRISKREQKEIEI